MKALVSLSLLALTAAAQADSVVSMHMVDESGSGPLLGQVTISESPYGLVFTPQLRGLPAGVHGFHLHQNASCAPQLRDGNASQPVLAPRLKASDLPGRALMIHAGGDNHADHPAALGGGGARVACGVIQ